MSNLLGKSWIAPPNVGSTVIGWAANGRAMKNYTASELRTLLETGYELSVKDYGAVGDGTTDDGPAFVLWAAAIVNAAAAGPVVGVIPPGTYDIVDIASTLNIAGNNVTIRGAGSASTKLLIGNTYDLFSKLAAVAASSYLQFSGFTIQGPGALTGTFGPSDFGTINLVTDVVLDDLIMRDFGSLAIAFRNCEQITTSNCRFERIGRGGLNIAECNRTVTTNCHFARLGDDAISLHERLTSRKSGNHSVSNCSFYMTQGIKGVGGRSISVTGCHFEFMAGGVLDVESSVMGSSEGANAGLNVTFTGNTIKDVFNNTYTTGHNQDNVVINLGGDAANATGLDAVPGYPDATGVIIRPEPYIYNYSASGSPLPVPPNINHVISGNSFLQTLPETAKFSDIGFGDFFGYEGVEVDPEVAYDELLDVDWIQVESYQNNTLIANNVVSGFSRALYLGKASSSNVRLRNFVMQGNILHNLRLCVMECRTSLANDPDGLDISFRGNSVDLDPYLVNTNRVSTGGWTSNAANTDGLFIKVRGNDVSAIRVFNNEFRNICSLSGGMKTFGNIYLCEPASINAFSTSNLGVGLVPQGERVLLIDSDPTAATYGSPVSAMVENATAMPATGTYVEGHFVTNSNPTVAGSASSKYVIRGWLRLTTGTGHVADTDWAEVRTLTGT